ncbi:YceI family protein [Lutimonas zeaxanthinifaciens]|uniref:YceI family protein n=1 Tax=Lutimonas zeaxanthinifaciens TaxID=3060215 RepID=UPI00265CA78D|nr:YceI family protein [Lutimonas sp. YSD2104]WKK66432.1 YceI family protein [Lutimonas sp. YSD2104]
MKNRVKTTAAALIIATITFAFTTIEDGKKEVNVETSSVTWKGYKVTGSHVGSIALKQGSLEFKDGALTGGEFVMDMTSIENTDLEGEYKGKLEGHLKSDDFFGVANYPTAKLVFNKVKSTGKNSYEVTGDLTIKDKTNPVTFEISVYGNKATANLKIDRTAYGVKYGSASFFDDLKDKAIYDEFDLVTDLEF